MVLYIYGAQSGHTRTVANALQQQVSTYILNDLHDQR